MAIPTNTPIAWRGTTKTLESNGASITNGSVVQANDASYDTVSDGEGAVDAEIVISCTFGTAPTEGSGLSIYARPLDVLSTNDTEVPEAARPTLYLGSFILNNVTTTQYSPPILVRNLPKTCDIYLHNNGSGQTVSAGWTLDITPYALTPKV